MWSPEVTGTIIVALIALAGTIINAVTARGKVSKKEAVEQEHRITVIEGSLKLINQDISHIKEHMFSRKDRECLVALNERVGTIYNALGTLIPKNLKNPPTMDGILDIVSSKVNETGWFGAIDYIKTEMPEQDRLQLLTYLEDQGKSRSRERRIWAGLLLNMIKTELNLMEKDPALCELEG